MRLKLKEDPREWQKFATVAALFLSVVSGLLWHRHHITALAWQSVLVTAALFLLLALVRPRAIRPLYRTSMRFSHAIGQVVGHVLLVLCFLLVLTPIGLLLRLLGHDLLQLHPPKDLQSYWKPARPGSHHDRAF